MQWNWQRCNPLHNRGVSARFCFCTAARSKLVRVWLLCVLCSKWAFYDADVSFTVQASSCMAVPAICDHMSRDSRQHCLRTWQHKISCDVCWTVNAGVKLDLDESSSFEKNKKKQQSGRHFQVFPLHYNTVSAAFFSPFFVSYVTQITQAWPLLSGFLFLHLCDETSDCDCNRRHFVCYPWEWVRNVRGLMQETSVTWHLITTISQPAALNIRSHWQVRNT